MPRLSHLHLSVSDLERSIAFYRDKLGLHLGFRGKNMADFDESGLVLDQTEEQVDGSAVTVGLAVEDVDATFSTLRDRGVVSDQPPQGSILGCPQLLLPGPRRLRDRVRNPIATRAVAVGAATAARHRGRRRRLHPLLQQRLSQRPHVERHDTFIRPSPHQPATVRCWSDVSGPHRDPPRTAEPQVLLRSAPRPAR